MKKVLMLLSALLLCICLISCNEKKEVQEKGPVATAVPSTPTPTVPILVGQKEDGDDLTMIKSVSYYVADPDTNEILPQTAFISADSELTPEQLMEFFADSMADYSVEINYNGVSLENKVVTLDFTEDMKQIAKRSDTLEKAVLDAVAQTMLDNFEECRGVSFLMDGGPYDSGNRYFEVGFIYMDR